MANKTYTFEIIAPMPAAMVFAALTDFSDKRLLYFPISRSRYRVLERGKTSALVQEGTGPIVSQERYDWSTKYRIWSVVEESNVVAPGAFTDVRLSPQGENGCRVVVTMEREFRGWQGRMLLASASVQGGKRFFRKAYYRVLRNIQKEMIRERSEGSEGPKKSKP